MVRYMNDLAEAGHDEAAAATGNLLQVILKSYPVILRFGFI